MADPALALPPVDSEMMRIAHPGDASVDPLAGAPLPVLPPGVPQPQSFADIMAGMQGRIAELPRPSEAMAAEQTARAARDRQGATLEAAAAEQDPKLRALEGAYEARGAQIAATPVPQAPVLPPPPSRGLRAFLATSPDEAPEATLQKVMAGVMALATSMGGLVRGDGRGALAALSGAMQGWHEGDKERADRAFADWKAKTDQMLTNYNLERQTYDDAIKAGNLPLEMRKTALLIGAQRWDNQKALMEFSSGSAEKWAQFVGVMSKEGNKLSEDVGKLALMKEEKDRARDLQERTLAETIRNHIAETSRKTKELTDIPLKELEVGVRTRLAADPEARAVIESGQVPPPEMIQSAIALANQDAINKMSSIGQNAANVPQRTPDKDRLLLGDIALAQSSIAELKRLAPTVKLGEIVGGVRPWINQMVTTGKAAAFPLPESVRSKLDSDQLRFLASLQDYGDSIVRVRTGAAFPEGEHANFLKWIPDQAVTPQALMARLDLQDDSLRARSSIIRQGLTGGGYRDPGITPPSMAPSGSGGDKANLEPFVKAAAAALYPGVPMIDILRDERKTQQVRDRALADQEEGARKTGTATAVRPAAEWTYNPKTGKLEKVK